MASKERAVPRFRTLDLAYTALFAVLMAVCAWISTPKTPISVPFTLQTFAMFAALTTLGGRRGLWAVVVYLLMGLVGLPVFTGFQGGPGRGQQARRDQRRQQGSPPDAPGAEGSPLFSCQDGRLQPLRLPLRDGELPHHRLISVHASPSHSLRRASRPRFSRIFTAETVMPRISAVSSTL
mgnify:CR=1 FL=1